MLLTNTFRLLLGPRTEHMAHAFVRSSLSQRRFSVLAPSRVYLQYLYSSRVARFEQPRPSHWDRSLEPEGPKCHCRQPAVKYTAARGHPHNKGRQFLACRHPRESPTNCGYFAWEDGTIAFGPEAWKRWGEDKGVAESEWKDAMQRHWARRSELGEDIPEIVMKALGGE